MFYCNNDPVKKKPLVQKEVRSRSVKSATKVEYYLSLEGVLKFMYNFSVIDRFVRRKSLALILDGFQNQVDFSQFLRLLRLVADEMYFDYPAINSTAKLKRLLQKLNVNSALNVCRLIT